MKLLFRILITAILVLVIAKIMKGVIVDEFTTALTVAIVLGLLNFFVKPILVLFTLPVTIFTLGLFLLVIGVKLCTSGLIEPEETRLGLVEFVV